MYAKINNDQIEQYPYTTTELRSDNPSTLFKFDPLTESDIRTAFNVVEVKETSKPDFNAQTHKCVEKTPELKNGEWTQVWETVAKTSDEKTKADSEQWVEIRNERNQKLQETDWQMVKSLELGENAAGLKTYRQKLRDIPQEQTNPFAITWPEL